ncbi:hypothetical protein [Bacillus sp. FSL K6-3431]|uniref:hypothetical protein n=1 Tax=Bacillus sp. FSL K6-3431 TaxID=2921500 RepID=UPI0030F8CF19
MALYSLISFFDGKHISLIVDLADSVDEGELEQTRSGFRTLKECIDSLREQDGQTPDIIFLKPPECTHKD